MIVLVRISLCKIKMKFWRVMMPSSLSFRGVNKKFMPSSVQGWQNLTPSIPDKKDGVTGIWISQL
jgi:hypothetical protein